jgi:hypothetical protein
VFSLLANLGRPTIASTESAGILINMGAQTSRQWETSENLNSTWILFEAGRAGQVKGAKLIPLLLGLEFSDQRAAVAVPGQEAGQGRLGRDCAFDQSAGRLARARGSLAAPVCQLVIIEYREEVRGHSRKGSRREARTASARDPRGILTTVRGRFAKLDDSLSEAGYRSRRRRFRPMHPMMFECMSHMISEEATIRSRCRCSAAWCATICPASTRW